MRRLAPAFFLVFLLLAIPGALAAALEVPFLSGRIVDEAQMLPPDAEQRLTAQSQGLEERAGAQLVVLTIPSLDGEDIEGYSYRVAETWGLGGERNDDGVLFLIVRDDRRLRIEVGRGLEGQIPDIIAGRIVNEVVVPRFRNGDFVGGIEQGVGAIAGFITGEGRLPEEEDPVGIPCSTLLFILFILFFFVLPAIRAARHSDGRRYRGRRGGSVIILPGGFGGGGRGGGGFGGGGFGGGFSGGGGSFGGGGASGSW